MLGWLSPGGAGSVHGSFGTLGCLGFDVFIDSVIAFAGGLETFDSNLTAVALPFSCPSGGFSTTRHDGGPMSLGPVPGGALSGGFLNRSKTCCGTFAPNLLGSPIGGFGLGCVLLEETTL